MEKGEREGQWHAHFPRNDRLCCSYEPHVLLANIGQYRLAAGAESLGRGAVCYQVRD